MSVASVLEREGNLRDMVEVQRVEVHPSMPRLGLDEEFIASIGNVYARELDSNMTWAGSLDIAADHLSAAIVIYGREFLEKINEENLHSRLTEGLNIAISKPIQKEEDRVENVKSALIAVHGFKSAFPQTFEGIMRDDTDFKIRNFLNTNIETIMAAESLGLSSVLEILYRSSFVQGSEKALAYLDSLWPRMKPVFQERVKKLDEKVVNKNRDFDHENFEFSALAHLRLLDPSKYDEIGVHDRITEFGLYMVNEYFESDADQFINARFEMLWYTGVISGDIIMGPIGPLLNLSPRIEVVIGEMPAIERFQV